VIKVTFYEDSRKRLSSFFADVRTDVSVEQKKGHIRISWPETMRSDPAVKAIVETARLSVEQIARQFPANVHCNNAPDNRVV
jgi:hypothetical protein